MSFMVAAVIAVTAMLVQVSPSTSLAATKTTAAKSTAAKSTKTTTSSAKSTAKSSKKKPALIPVGRTKAQRDAVRRKRAATSAKLNAAKANRKQLEGALDDVTSDLKAESASLASARKAVAAAEQELSESRAREAAIESRVRSLSQQRVEAAVSTYSEPATIDISAVLRAQTVGETTDRDVYLSSARNRQADLADRLRAYGEDLALERAQAARAEEKAKARRAKVKANVESLAVSKKRTQQLAAQAEELYEARLSEAEGLASLDSKLSKQLAAENAELARRLNAAGRAAGIGAGGSGSFTGKAGSFKAPSTGSTNGIVVAASIRSNVAALLAAAAADGIFLSGSGYRSAQGQIAVRIRNCGSSSYAIYQMRSSSCRPPTARPGSSQHERGLAIDFTQNGRTLTRSTSAYRWLKANAHRFGMYNLPSEPWHWSTTGR
jgi:LAS superfamily LD-carboxypeptidase LdcB